MAMLYLFVAIKSQFRIENQSVNNCDRALRSASRRDGDAPRRYQFHHGLWNVHVWLKPPGEGGWVGEGAS